ncbi:hypothetical protein [Streptomyces sp. NRRL B-3229]|uniref:hypothetical protein n=1 Tax=Streptomyces sp. NRRL B-3229 TaxID=1463836 RepID=UPI000567D6AF|nr:hypothetical protein [Streptomyces sp. NRRL B-3229]
MIRRPVAWIVAVVLFAEAFGVALLNWIMANVVDGQNMSLAGLDPDAMVMSSKVGAVVFGLYFALCALVALRNRPPAGLGRILLISVAVVHGLLAAVAWALIGRPQFAFMIVMLALIVLLLMSYDDHPEPAAATGPQDTDGPGDSEASDEPKDVTEAAPEAAESPLTPPPAPTTP